MNADERELLSTVLQEVRTLRAELKVSHRAVLSREEAAEYLGISPRSLHSLFERGELKRVEMGPGRVGYRREELHRYVVEHETVFQDTTQERGKQLYSEAKAKA